MTLDTTAYFESLAYINTCYHYHRSGNACYPVQLEWPSFKVSLQAANLMAPEPACCVTVQTV